MPEPPDYDAIEQKQWRENAEQVPLRLRMSDRHLLKRIETFMARFGFALSDVLSKIRADPMFAAHFAKEPRRTGLHEKTAAEWLDVCASISGFRTLPKSGGYAYYITSDGEIRKGMRRAPSKSLDFHWRTGETEFFAAHKYTKESGGNQDSQYKEMLTLLQHFLRATESGKVLMVIVDGPYYTAPKMKELTNVTRTHEPRSFACHIEDVPGILESYDDQES